MAYRYYQRRNLRRIIRLSVYPVLTLFSAVFIAGNALDHDGLTLFPALVCLVLVAPAMSWCETRVMRTGLQESSEGFVNHGNLGSSVLPLRRIEQFQSRRIGLVDRVYAIGTDGVATPIQGLSQGQPVVWHDGESRDIVGVLNARLAVLKADGTSR